METSLTKSEKKTVAHWALYLPEVYSRRISDRRRVVVEKEQKKKQRKRVVNSY